MASITVEQALLKAMRDPTGLVFTTDEVTPFVLNHVQPSSTFSAQKVADYYWKINGNVSLWQPTISAGGGTYEYYNGFGGHYTTFSFKDTASVDARDPISVTGSRVDFNRCLEEMLVFTANHRALAYSQSVAGGSISPETARAELIAQAEILRGVISL